MKKINVLYTIFIIISTPILLSHCSTAKTNITPQLSAQAPHAYSTLQRQKMLDTWGARVEITNMLTLQAWQHPSGSSERRLYSEANECFKSTRMITQGLVDNTVGIRSPLYNQVERDYYTLCGKCGFTPTQITTSENCIISKDTKAAERIPDQLIVSIDQQYLATLPLNQRTRVTQLLNLPYNSRIALVNEMLRTGQTKDLIAAQKAGMLINWYNGSINFDNIKASSLKDSIQMGFDLNRPFKIKN